MRRAFGGGHADRAADARQRDAQPPRPDWRQRRMSELHAGILIGIVVGAVIAFGLVCVIDHIEDRRPS